MRREYMWYNGNSKDFGTRGYYEVWTITSTYFVFNLCPIFFKNHVGVTLVGFLLLKYELPHSLSNLLAP
jgi:hypothetical protein